MGAADVPPLLPLRAFPFPEVPCFNPKEGEDGRWLLVMAAA